MTARKKTTKKTESPKLSDTTKRKLSLLQLVDTGRDLSA